MCSYKRFIGKWLDNQVIMPALLSAFFSYMMDSIDHRICLVWKSCFYYILFVCLFAIIVKTGKQIDLQRMYCS